MTIDKTWERELQVLPPDLTSADIKKIIANRPYTNKEQLLSRNVLPRATYLKIRDRVTVEKK